MLRGTLLLTLLGISFSVFGHGGKNVDLNQWHSKSLKVKHDSNWSTEHCFQLKGEYELQYQFSSNQSMNFDFHLHPVNKNKEYSTDHLAKSKNTKQEKGQLTVNKAGTYCFDFTIVNRVTKDDTIHLKYRID